MGNAVFELLSRYPLPDLLGISADIINRARSVRRGSGRYEHISSSMQVCQLRQNHRAGSRTERDLRIMVTVHLDWIAYRRTLYELPPSDAKNTSSPRNCNLHLCRYGRVTERDESKHMLTILQG